MSYSLPSNQAVEHLWVLCISWARVTTEWGKITAAALQSTEDYKNMHWVDKYTEEDAQTSSVSIYKDVCVYEYIEMMGTKKLHHEIIHHF